jgi:hypothetical protein
LSAADDLAPVDLRQRLTPVGRGSYEARSCVTIQHSIGVGINQKEE